MNVKGIDIKSVYYATHIVQDYICKVNSISPYYCERKGDKSCKFRSCRSANALCLEIERKINDKTFNYADYFPNSKALPKISPDVEPNIEYTYKEHWEKNGLVW